ncbi:hypothetical protein BDY17DRAFT_290822 [Neohortaea acidophila]|uniref:Ubiquitin 3 binding protein But2 C-terminal domain-containing protein n=1 Tax=Neohortaea acidophila TaxID=245834 RepID=A0A6A6Q271_9PEZI|nr:uncharacterized protein BDY17DRAFT_290822 [Neohortaea acidophila]KAF2486084.1 hypothetical protein BDY17DRAFT_290822 [Neohortaea acidophila]
MPLFRTTIAALCICTGVASALAICPSNVNFKLEAAGKYLTPGYPCESHTGCGAYFSVDSSTDFEYTIAAGTSSLLIANVPAGSLTPAGLYAHGTAFAPGQLTVMFGTGPPRDMNCTIVPDLSLLDGSCNLECQGVSEGVKSSGQSIFTDYANQWFLGQASGMQTVTVKVRYVDGGLGLM